MKKEQGDKEVVTDDIQ
jgi:2-polyprenyl-3-methyl-5-hydroxy-6-metoxy-1,4-benzoquinol methylase